MPSLKQTAKSDGWTLKITSEKSSVKINASTLLKTDTKYLQDRLQMSASKWRKKKQTPLNTLIK